MTSADLPGATADPTTRATNATNATNATKVVSRPVSIAILTVSDTRTEETDTSGRTLVERLRGAGHVLADKRIVRDEPDQIRSVVAAWIADPGVEVIVSTGGTGITGRDVTVDALGRFFDRTIPGFGELFRWLSYQEIGTSTLTSRATAGLSGTTLIFAIPGSTGACRTAWDRILSEQLDIDHRPCNLVALLPRLGE